VSSISVNSQTALKRNLSIDENEQTQTKVAKIDDLFTRVKDILELQDNDNEKVQKLKTLLDNYTEQQQASTS